MSNNNYMSISHPSDVITVWKNSYHYAEIKESDTSPNDDFFFQNFILVQREGYHKAWFKHAIRQNSSEHCSYVSSHPASASARDNNYSNFTVALYSPQNLYVTLLETHFKHSWNTLVPRNIGIIRSNKCQNFQIWNFSILSTTLLEVVPKDYV